MIETTDQPRQGPAAIRHANATSVALSNQPPGRERADVDIGVIYTWERHFMPQLLSSLSRSADDLRSRLILVDNRSDDGTADWEGYFRRTHVLRNEARLGYGANLNRILAASTAPYVLLLNTDMYFDAEEQCVSKMVHFMRQNPDCGIAGCRLYRADGSFAHPARRRPTLPVIVARRFGLANWLHRSVGNYLYEDQPDTATFDCEWLSGCFLLVRREAFESIGYFDTDFVKYFEDVDICLRMARGGWRVTYHGATYCYHLEQRASRKLLSADAWRHGMSYLRWLRKWGPSPRWEPVVARPLQATPRPARRAA